MTLDSTSAALFALLAVVAARLAPSGRPRTIVVAAISILVFGTAHPAAMLPMLAVLGLALLGVRAARQGSRATGIAAIVAIVAVLVAAKWPGAPWRSATGAAWTVGLSYFAFHALAAILETRRGVVRDADPWTVAAHLTFFPTALSGPIKSLGRFIENDRRRSSLMEDVADGAPRILAGLFKKIVLAATLAPMIAPLQTPGHSTALALVIAVYAYALFIYWDFSGYTDIAVGLARVMGYRIEENFDRPYRATDIRAFWRSWHMSLTAFLRDALYIPLGGNRVGAARGYLNIAAVFLVIGAWHGLEAHFLAWGAWHAAGMIAHRWWSARHPAPASPSRARVFAAWCATFHFVAAGWVLFACDLDKALLVLKVLAKGVGW